MNKALPLGIGIAVITIAVLAFSFSNQNLEDGGSILDTKSEPIPPIIQQDLREMIDDWMENPQDDDSEQRLEIMKAYYTFQESGQKLSDDQAGRVMYNQIVKMVSFDIPKTELDQIKQNIRNELRELGFNIPIQTQTTNISSECLGTARCITGTVTSVIDGDTLEVDGQVVRFALVDTPKMKYDGGQALSFLEQICPVGSPVLIDQDDNQLEDAYGRVLGLIYCNDLNLNQELLDSGVGDLYSAFCDQSEFSTQPWAQKHGCNTSENETSVVNDIGYSMSSEELEQQMTLDPNLVVIDMRDSNSYMNGHITSSSVDIMEGATLEKRIKTMFGKIPDVAESMHVVLVGDSQSNALDSAQIMNDAGITTSYLTGGIDSWDDELSTKMTPTTIDSKALYQQLQNQDDVYLLDVREPDELEVTMISGSTNIPLSDIFVEGNLSEIPTDKPVVIICATGNRATIATYELSQHDIDFQVLDGGIKAWDKYLEENNLPKY